MEARVIWAADSRRSRIDETWGSLTWLAGMAPTGTSGLTLGRVVIKPGKQNPRHSHPNCDEVLYLLAGRLEHSVGAATMVVEAGDTLLVPAGVAHNARNIGPTDADMIVAYNSGDRQFTLEDQPQGDS